MTAQEREEYNRLSSEGKEYYDMYMRRHPGASHATAYKLAVFNTKAGEIVDRKNNRNENINLDDPRVQKSILEETGDFIRRMAPRVWAQVCYDFQRAIAYLGDLIRRGLDWVGENIIDPVIEFLDDLFG